jgi:hypothetical protein
MNIKNPELHVYRKWFYCKYCGETFGDKVIEDERKLKHKHSIFSDFLIEQPKKIILFDGFVPTKIVYIICPVSELNENDKTNILSIAQKYENDKFKVIVPFRDNQENGLKLTREQMSTASIVAIYLIDCEKFDDDMLITFGMSLMNSDKHYETLNLKSGAFDDNHILKVLRRQSPRFSRYSI